MKNTVKQLISNLLPAPMLRLVEKQHFLNNLRNFDLSEEPDLLAAQQFFKEGSVALDIGANIGLYSKYLSEAIGDKGKVVCVEPMPRTFDILSNNIAKLRLNNVTPVHAAVSSTPGRVTMELPANDWGGVNYYRAHIAENADSTSSNSFSIDSITLDSLIESQGLEFDRVSFVKVDVEGFELDCLKGSSELLNKGNAVWLVEVAGSLDNEGSPASELAALFAAQGYHPFINESGTLRPRRSGDAPINYFFKRSE
jgi:FkbM family methyltransferase